MGSVVDKKEMFHVKTNTQKTSLSMLVFLFYSTEKMYG